MTLQVALVVKMNTLRALPILNRPSRPSSPAPGQAPTQTSTMTAFAQPTTIGLGLQHTASEPGKPRSKSLQRQVADRVSSFHANGHANKSTSPSQPLGSGGPSPPGSRANTPKVPNGPLPPGDPVSTPSSGHMDVIGLRLNDSVNKACAGVEFRARKGFRKGSGWAVGEAVVK